MREDSPLGVGGWVWRVGEGIEVGRTHNPRPHVCVWTLEAGFACRKGACFAVLCRDREGRRIREAPGSMKRAGEVHEGEEKDTRKRPRRSVRDELAEAEEAVVAQDALARVRSPGANGRKILVQTNVFPVYSEIQQAVLYHTNLTYRDSGEEVEKRELRLQAFNILLENEEVASKIGGGEGLYFDGAYSIYATKEIFPGDELELDFEPRPRKELRVKLKKTRTLDLSAASLESAVINPATLNALNGFLKASQLRIPRLLNLRHSFYNMDKATYLGGGVTLYPGFRQSVQQISKGLGLKVDFTANAFEAPMVLIQDSPKDSYIFERQRALNPESVYRKSSLTDSDFHALKRLLKKKLVRTVHRKKARVYEIRDITSMPADKLDGWKEEDPAYTVAQYFEAQYGAPLKYPNLPCAVVNKKGQKANYVPLEMLEVVPGQPVKRGRLSPQQVSQMMNLTCVKPQERFSRIMGEGKVRPSPEFQVRVEQPIQAKARVLDSPMLAYGRSRMAQVESGSWRTKNVPFYKPVPLESWGVVVFSKELPRGYLEDRDIDSYLRTLQNVAQGSGMRVDRPAHVLNAERVEARDSNGIAEALQECSEKVKSTTGRACQLLLCIIPGTKGDHAYRPEILHACDMKLGIISKKVRTEKVISNRGLEAILMNVVMEINAKIGGINQKLERVSRVGMVPFDHFASTAFMGLDVSRKTPGSAANIPRVAVLTSTTDDTGFRMIATHRANTRPVEEDSDAPPAIVQSNIVAPLAEMAKETILNWAKLNQGRVPKYIVMYRNGISESQIRQVLEEEIPKLFEGCADATEDLKTLYPDISLAGCEKDGKYCPKLTYVCSMVGHNVRLAPMGRANREDMDRSGNVCAGVVLDQQIVSPHYFCFYMSSHGGLKGTKQVSLYTVLRNDLNLNSDHLQSLSYVLCHAYARCPRVLSAPCPMYYAGKILTRIGGALRIGEDFAMSDTASVVSMGSRDFSLMDIPMLHKDLALSMYFV